MVDPSCSIISNFAGLLAKMGVKLVLEYGFIVGALTCIGIVSLLSAIGQKAFQGFKIIFIICIALPAIIILGLLNKKTRNDRLKELGEIRAYVKNNPDKWKNVVYYFLMIIAIGIGLYGVIWLMTNMIIPANEINNLFVGVASNITNQSLEAIQ